MSPHVENLRLLLERNPLPQNREGEIPSLIALKTSSTGATPPLTNPAWVLRETKPFGELVRAGQTLSKSPWHGVSSVATPATLGDQRRSAKATALLTVDFVDVPLYFGLSQTPVVNILAFRALLQVLRRGRSHPPLYLSV